MSRINPRLTNTDPNLTLTLTLKCVEALMGALHISVGDGCLEVKIKGRHCV